MNQLRTTVFVEQAVVLSESVKYSPLCGPYYSYCGRPWPLSDIFTCHEKAAVEALVACVKVVTVVTSVTVLTLVTVVTGNIFDQNTFPP